MTALVVLPLLVVIVAKRVQKQIDADFQTTINE